MTNPFIRELCGHAPLPTKDIELLEKACGTPTRSSSSPGSDPEGDKPGRVFVILQGWACHYKLLPEGTCQITSLLMPGDCCYPHASVLQRMEHSIPTLTPARVAMVPRKRLEELVFTHSAITRAFWWNQLVSKWWSARR